MASAAARHRHTLRDYLEVEESSLVRHEYVGGEIIAMAGGTPEHAALAGAVLSILGEQLRGGRCRVYSSDLRIRVLATGLATYADASVVCGEVERDPESPTHVTNPTLVVEVLSRSTEEHDRGEKREHYQRVAALREYLLISQDRRQAELWRRQPDGEWSRTVHGPADRVELTSIGCRFRVDDLYAAAGVS